MFFSLFCFEANSPILCLFLPFLFLLSIFHFLCGFFLWHVQIVFNSFDQGLPPNYVSLPKILAENRIRQDLVVERLFSSGMSHHLFVLPFSYSLCLLIPILRQLMWVHGYFILFSMITFFLFRMLYFMCIYENILPVPLPPFLFFGSFSLHSW